MPHQNVQALSRLVEELVTQLGGVRTANDSTSQLAHEVLQQETQEIAKLLEYVDDDKVADVVGDLEKIDAERTIFMPPETEVLSLEDENIALKVELQRLDLVESKMQEVVQEFKTAVQNVSESMINIERKYPQLLTAMEQGYEERLGELDARCGEVASSEQTTIEQLARLRDNLRIAEASFDTALDKVHRAL